MTVRRPALADRYAIHLPVDSGDTSRFVGTEIATGQSVVIAVTAGEWARLEKGSVSIAQRHLATVIDAVNSPDPSAFPVELDLPASGTAFVAELVRGKSLAALLREGPLVSDRAVAWTIRLLEGLVPLHDQKVPHGAISAAAVVAEPKLRPIAPLLSQLLVPPFREYASPERLAGEGPSVQDDLWAIGILLFEMLAAKKPFGAAPRLRSLPELGASDVTFMDDIAHGAQLAAILRRALSARPRRFSSASEMMTYLEHWERRVPLPASARTKPAPPQSIRAGAGPASWDLVTDEGAFGAKRLEATLDAAEQLRQNMLTQGVSMVVEPRPVTKQDAGFRAAPKLATSSRAPKSLAPKSTGPMSRRRPVSIGPELAAFAARARPKTKVTGFLLVAIGLLMAGGLLWAFYDNKPNGSGRAIASANLESPLQRQRPIAARPKLPEKEQANQCIRSYFRAGALRADVDLGFVCTDEDYLSVNRRLHEESMVLIAGSTTDSTVAGAAGAPGTPTGASASAVGAAEGQPVPSASTNNALVVRSGSTNLGWQLGWYELVATAVIRQSCCREAAPINLPESTGWCQQLQSVVRRIAIDSAKVGDISPGVRPFDETILCLLAQGKHVSYPYKAVPTQTQKMALQQFLKHAAEADAKRSSRR